MTAAASTATPPSCATSIAPRGRVLVVDDQIEIGEFLTQILDVIGHDGVAETNPQRALERLQDEHFDVVISDFKMPEMNGVEFYHEAVAARHDLAARFVFLTGDLCNMETEATLNALGAPLLGKPFRIDAVERVVGDILAKNCASI